MGNIKFNASKKTTIILLVVLFFVIGGSGGYLLWRVNQSKTVAPTDSSAGGSITPPGNSNCYCPPGGPDKPTCTCGCEGQPSCHVSGADCGGLCCIWPQVAWYLNGPEPGCACANRRTKVPENTKLECHDKVPRKDPPACPQGYIDIHRPANDPDTGEPVKYEPLNYSLEDIPKTILDSLYERKNSEPRCKPNGTDEFCFTQYAGEIRCDPCQNPYCIRRICKKAPEPPQPQCGDREVNQASEECDPPGSVCTKNGKQGVCDDFCKCPVVVDPPRVEKCDGIGKGTDISFVPSTVKKDATINYKYTMGDSKGIDLKSVSVLVNHSSFDVEKNLTPDTGTPKKATVDGKLDTSKVGNYHVLIAWKRPGESSFSELCQMRGNFTVEDVGAPKWDVGKTASEECIVDSAGESIAKLTYTITIKNNGNATGTITNVTDKLDSKVVGGSVTDISDGGTYSSSDRSIKWGSFNIAAGQTKTLTYSFTVRKDAFGVYDNVVIVKPSDGTDYIANASITADCVEEPYQPPVEGGKVPETGLFDESENLVIMGGILLFLGLGWTWLNRTYEIVNGKLVQRSKERFEKRVVKN